MTLTLHPILQQSFALIDQEVGEHGFTAEEYPILQRVIHSTADFDYKHLLRFSPGVIETAIASLYRGTPIITDVSMVKQGVSSLVQQTFANPLISAVEQAAAPLPGKTRTETGLIRCLQMYPEAIYVLGNAPTALLALCDGISQGKARPAFVVAAPVGFVAVVESKVALARLSVPQVRVEGRKGGSAVAAAILNALLVLADNRSASQSRADSRSNDLEAEPIGQP